MGVAGVLSQLRSEGGIYEEVHRRCRCAAPVRIGRLRLCAGGRARDRQGMRTALLLTVSNLAWGRANALFGGGIALRQIDPFTAPDRGRRGGSK
jgi:hypothetical protein